MRSKWRLVLAWHRLLKMSAAHGEVLLYCFTLFFCMTKLTNLTKFPLLKLVNLVNLVMQKIALFIFFEPYVRKCSISCS